MKMGWTRRSKPARGSALHSMKSTIPCILLGLSTLALSQALEIRTWTDTQQRKVQAKLAAIQGDSVVLELQNGRKIPFPVAKLSAEDTAYIELNKDQLKTLPTPSPTGKKDSSAAAGFSAPWPTVVKFSEDPEISVVEENVEKNRFVYESASYRYTCDVRLSKSVIKGFAVMFEATNQFCRLLPLHIDGGDEENGKLPIILFENEDDYFAAGGPKGSAGVFISSEGKGKVLVPLTSLGVRKVGSGYMLDRDKSSKTLPHELTHQLTPGAYFETGARGWFTEGIAEYVAVTPYRSGTYNVRNNVSAIVDYVTGYGAKDMGGRALGKTIRIPALKSFMLQDYSHFLSNPQTNYGLSLLLTYYFFHMDGEEDGARVKKFLQALRDGKTEAAALEVLFDGRSAEQVEQEISKAWSRRGVDITFGS